MSPRPVTLLAAGLLAAVLLAAPAAAKLDPAHRWRTIETPRFVTHFHEGCDGIAARAAGLAEEVHARLAPRIGWEPREKTRLVIADDADAAGGWASPYPYNQILIDPTPPLGEPGLGTTRYDDWLRLVITHEYTHILQLDLASRLPLALRSVFGRLYFPNALQPEWLIEGLATYEETELTAGGRGRSPGAEMILRMAAIEGPFPTLDQMAVFPDAWPAGQVPYLFGESFLRHLAARFGREGVAAISSAYGGRALPFLVESTGRAALGAEYRDLWLEWSSALRERYRAQQSAAAGRGLTQSAALTDDGGFNGAPAWSPDGTRIAWLRADGHDYPGIWVMNADASGRRRLVRNAFSTASSGATLAWSPDGGRIYYTGRSFVRGAAVVNDLWAHDLREDREVRLTRGLRARDPHPSPDGRTLVLVTAAGGLTRLALLDLEGTLPAREPSRLRFLTGPTAEQFAAPRWSPDGGRIAVSVRLPEGGTEIRVIDRGGAVLARLARGAALVGAPAWSPDGSRIFLASDETGIFNLFSWDPDSGRLAAATNVLGGAFSPSPSPDGRRLAFADYTARGFDIRVLDLTAAVPAPPGEPAAIWAGDRGAPPPGEASVPPPSTARPYSPLDTILPRLWVPSIFSSPESGTLVGFVTGGQDVLQRHRYQLTGLYGTASGRLMHRADYAYDGLRPTLRLFSSDIDRTYAAELRLGGRPAAYTERERTLGAEATLAFPGFDRSQSLSVGYGYRFLSSLSSLPPSGPGPDTGPATGSLGSARLSWEVSSAQRQRHSISPERGGSLALGLERFQRGVGSERSFTRAAADAAAYLPLPARHHVLAARLFLGGSRGDAPPQGAFLLGGDAPGDAPRSLDDRFLSLRGYPAGVSHGGSAALAGIEYRFPLFEVGRGGVSAPLFLRRVHGAVFVDAGEAWDGGFRTGDIRTGLGAEVRLDLFLSYFVPVTLHLGAAVGLDEGGGVYPTLGVRFPLGLAGGGTNDERR